MVNDTTRKKQKIYEYLPLDLTNKNILYGQVECMLVYSINWLLTKT